MPARRRFPARRRAPARRRGGGEPVGGQESVEQWDGGDWVVRRVTGSASAKAYRCPGCDHLIAPVTPHVVAWPVEGSTLSGGGLAERRHWHSGCWLARERRRPR